MVFNSFLDKFKNLVGDLFCLVEERLLLVILPVECQVKHPDRLPKIAQLSTCSVDNPRDFVRNNKLEILQAQ